MDLTGFFQTISSGGPDVIFVLCVLVTLFLTGEVRVKREIEDRDKIIEKQEQRNEDMLHRFERQEQLFEQSLSLIKDELLPMVREEQRPRRHD